MHCSAVLRDGCDAAAVVVWWASIEFISAAAALVSHQAHPSREREVCSALAEVSPASSCLVLGWLAVGRSVISEARAMEGRP